MISTIKIDKQRHSFAIFSQAIYLYLLSLFTNSLIKKALEPA
jgi:hypothetical protein